MAAEIKIIEAQSRRDIRRFTGLPGRLNRKDPNWVPKLDMDVRHILGAGNPFWKHAWKKLFIAQKNGEIVGRIAAVIDWNFVEFQGEKTGFFGFFESADDPETAAALFEECGRALASMEMEKMMGPMNPSSNDECGILVEGFDMPPRIMMPYNPRYYPELIEGAGLSKAKDLLAVNMQVDAGPRARLEKFAQMIKKRYPGLHSRPVKIKSFQSEVGLIRDIYNSAWVKNWGFVPWTDDEINDIAKQSKPLVLPELVQIGFDGTDPVGFLLALPDYNEVIKKTGSKLLPIGWIKFLIHRKKINNLRLMAMGVKHEYHNKGIGAIMYYNSLLAAQSCGFRECEFSWILEDNHDTLKIGSLMGGEIYKRYRIYKKNLT